MVERYPQGETVVTLCRDIYRSRYDFTDMLINGMKTMLNVESDYAREVLRKCPFFNLSLSLSLPPSLLFFPVYGFN